jgi:hypothetical protein
MAIDLRLVLKSKMGGTILTRKQRQLFLLPLQNSEDFQFLRSLGKRLFWS